MLHQAVRNCDTAYRDFFGSPRGECAGRMGAPRFESRKDNRQATRFTKGAFTATSDRNPTPAKIGAIEVARSRDLPSVPSSVTVVQTADDRCSTSFVVVVGDDALPFAVDEHGEDGEIGLDLGLPSFVVGQHGQVIASSRFLRRAERKLKRAQCAVSRAQKGTNHRREARRRWARQHAKVLDTRTDWLHQETTKLIGENCAITVKDLAVSGLVRTRLATSVHDASWGTFRRLLADGRALRS